MRDVKRCDVCRAKAQVEPQTVSDVLCWLAPPVELLAALERWSKMRRLSEPIRAYLERWQKVNGSDPVPEVDKLSGAPRQGKLLDGPGDNGYGE